MLTAAPPGRAARACAAAARSWSSSSSGSSSSPTKARLSTLLLIAALLLAPHHNTITPASAACKVTQRERDCDSCVPSDVHDPTRNLKPFGPAIPEITLFNTQCRHYLAACRTDGSGSQMQAKLSAYAYSQLTGSTYVHVPISALDHFNPEDQAKMTSSLEQFFNLGHGEMTLKNASDSGIKVCSVLSCFSFFDNYDGIHCWDMVKFQLLRKYRSTPKPKTYFLMDDQDAARPRTRSLTVAIHIRRGDVNVHKATDGDRFNSNEYYIEVLLRIQQGLAKLMSRRVQLDVAILSEGVPADFESILQAFPAVRLFLGTDLLRSLHTLITADIMIMARSSMSYVAAIYNEGVVVYDPYWHKQQSTWVLNDKNNSATLIDSLSDPAIHNLLVNRLKSRRMRKPALEGSQVQQ